MSSNHREIMNRLRSQLDVGSSHIEHVHAEPRKRQQPEANEIITAPRDATLLERIRGKLALRQMIDVDDKAEG
jgi:hypothetical protein